MNMETAGVHERRQRPRFRSEWPFRVTTPDTHVEGVVKNISPLGAFISAKELPALSEKFLLIIEPPHRQPLEVIGKVVWRVPLAASDGEPRIGSGVKFLHISEGDSKFLHDVVASVYIIEPVH